MKRLLDVLFSLLALIVLLPLELGIAVAILLSSPGRVLYRQSRVGKNNVDFQLLKFRTMKTDADKNGELLTVGNDSRIIGCGHFLRKYKLDELPQLLNIIKGDMSIVGPRPEVRKYVNLYDDRQRQVLSVRPGLTDYASIQYIAESELLANSPYPEKTYIEEIMPAKLELNLKYIEHQSLREDIKLIFKTLLSIFQK